MSSPLDLLQGREPRRYLAGDIVIEQGGDTGCLYFLVEGEVEVLKDNVLVAVTSEPGAVFGEMAALLRGCHTATVRAAKPSSFLLVDNPREFLETSPTMCLRVCELLARRLDALNKYLVDVKHQFEGHDHIGMVDEVLETLMHRQSRPRVRPKDSTIRHGELTD